jgi:hypothetical protein
MAYSFYCLFNLERYHSFSIETEMELLINNSDSLPLFMQEWLQRIFLAVKTTNTNYPYLSYGTDWLAFAHIVIVTVFIGPLKDPLKNIWVIQFGMIACIMVFPLALIPGPIRHIPFFWQMIDCSFGAIGLIPLLFCYKRIKQLEALNK